MSNKILVFAGIGVLILLAIVIGFNGINGLFLMSEKTDSIRIGLVSPLTGEAASFGQSILAGATLAVDEINSKGGINGKKIELFVEDDKCDAQAGFNASQKLVNINNVNFVVGFVCSTSAATSVGLFEEQKIPTILLMAASPNLTKEDGYIFRIYPSNTLQGEEAAKFVVQKLNKKKLAIVMANNDWGVGLGNAFSNKLKELDGEVVLFESIDSTTLDYRSIFAKVKSSGADVLYLPLYPADSVFAFKQIKELGLSIPIIGTDAWSGEEVFTSPYSEGMLFIVPKVNLSNDFLKRVNSQKGFENTKLTYGASLAFDAIKILASAKAKSESNFSLIVQELRSNEFKGESLEKIIFNSKGDINEYTFDVMKIENKQAVNYFWAN
jgi:branched-chain amino acid transport system substrate-binding protein